MKKLFSIFIAIIFMLSITTTNAIAAESTVKDSIVNKNYKIETALL